MPNMPQDGLRSAVYRSFMKCDDPKGVVECWTIRKSKTSSKKLEGKVENPRMPKNLNTSSSYKEEGKERVVSKNVTEDFQNPSSFQLIEASRGGQKLNQVIDSWSNGMPFDGHSKEIAKDLLKGALDLQESLVMLGKLQEASQYMNRKEKSRGERIDEMGIERMNSSRFTDQNYQMGFQKPRLSADGSSRDCFEELRTAIRDGLARQNLLPPGSNEKKAHSDRRTLDSAMDIASTSSSQSSMANFHSSFDSSLSSKAPQKSKGSSLIAKLMGLEEIPSQAAQTNPRNQLESDKISSPRRPMFDIDKLKARRPEFAAYKVDGEQKKLREIVETMQFKGLLKSNSAKEFGLQSHHSHASDSKMRFNEDAPPIVIIKPLHFSRVEAEEPHLQKFIRDVGARDKHEVLRNWKTNELQPQTVDGEGALNSNEMCRRLEGEEAPIERLSQECSENCKDIQAKTEETVVKTNGKLSSNKLKASVPVNQIRKKKAIEKKVDKIQKVNLNGRKPAEMENVKSKAVSKSHDQAKVTSAKERKPEIKSNISKARNFQKNSTSSSPISKHTRPDKSHSYGGRKKSLKNEKPVKEPLAANLVVENVGSKNHDKLLESIDLASTTSAATADCLFTEEGTDASEIQIKDQSNSSQNSPCNVPMGTTQSESCIKSAEEANDCISHNATQKNCFRTKTNAEDLLLSSPSFLSFAKELFNINPNQAIVLQTTSLDISEKADTRLLLNCANELMQHKSQRCKQAIHPLLLNPARNSKISVSLARLVEELCSGIENLTSYSKLGGEELPVDRTYAVLERDLRSKGVVNGPWDLGWRHSFSVVEVEQVVGDIEKLVFSGLIEEMFTDFVV